MRDTETGQDNFRLPAATRIYNLFHNIRYSFIPSKPLLVLRLARKTLEAAVLRRAVPRQIELALDYACNLNCSHCSAKNLARPRSERMTLDDYSRLYRELNKLGIVSYIFTGGEPLFFLDWLLEVIRIFEPHRNLISIQSNTLLLSDEVAARLKSAGVDLILGSVDSFHSDNNEEAIALDKVEKTIAMCRRHGMDMTYCTVLTHSNIRSPMLDRLIAFMRRLRVLLFFNVAVPVGAWTDNTDVILTPEDQRHLREIIRKNPHTRFDFSSNFGGFGCPAFKERLYITPYGEVLGCPFLQITFGNVRKGASVAAIRDSAMRSPYFDHYHKLCLAGEDQEFMSFYIPAHNSAKRLPLPLEALERHIAAGQSGEPSGQSGGQPGGKTQPPQREQTSCDWCGATAASPTTSLLRDEEGRRHLPQRLREERFRFVRCDGCGLVRLETRPAREDLAEYYSGEYCCFQDYSSRGAIMGALSKVLARRKAEQIRRFMPASSAVLLDYGCGSGTWLRELKDLGMPWRMIGTDVNAQAIERLKASGIEAHVCDDTDVHGFIEPGSIGVIHLFHVIEHVPSPLALLQALHRLLAPGGVVLGQTPNIAALEARLFGDDWNQWHVPRHFVLFDKATLRRHAERAGFEVLSVSDSLSAATQWAGSLTKAWARKGGRDFRGIGEPLYAPLTLAAIPLTMAQMALGAQTSHQDFILRKPLE